MRNPRPSHQLPRISGINDNHAPLWWWLQANGHFLKHLIASPRIPGGQLLRQPTLGEVVRVARSPLHRINSCNLGTRAIELSSFKSDRGSPTTTRSVWG